MSTRGISQHPSVGLAPSQPPPPAPHLPHSLAWALPTRCPWRQRRFAVAGSLDLERRRVWSCATGGNVLATPQSGSLRRPHLWGSLRSNPLRRSRPPRTGQFRFL